MTEATNKPSLNFLLFISLALAAINLFLLFFKFSTNLPWVNFAIYFLSVLAVIIFVVMENKVVSNVKKNLIGKDKRYLLILFILVTFLSFFRLKTYPFISVGDELRDSGLNAQLVLRGEITDFFNYGNYNGFGKIIPVISSFFYRIFGPSIWTYRFPTALLAIADSILLYFLLRRLVKPLPALLASILYITFPLHLFFARTELVVAFSSFWLICILLAYYFWRQSLSYSRLVFLALLLGIASQYHTPSRIVAVLTLVISSVLIIFIDKKHSWQKKGALLATILLFYLVGFGPMLLYSNQETFLQSQRFSLTNGEFSSLIQEIINLVIKYWRSLMVWVTESTTSRYPDPQPLLSPFTAIFMFLGIIAAYFHKEWRFLAFALFFVFALPFTNSAMTDSINADHRLTVFLPFASIFIALGLAYCLNFLKNTFSYQVLIVACLIYASSITIHFFSSYMIVNNRHLEDYLTMNLIYLIKEEEAGKVQINEPNFLCLHVSSEIAEKLEMLHYKEQFRYFLPKHSIQVVAEEKLTNAELYAFQGRCLRNFTYKPVLKKVIYCSQEKSVSCPVDFIGNINLNY